MSRYRNAVADPKVMTVGIPFRVMMELVARGEAAIVGKTKAGGNIYELVKA